MQMGSSFKKRKFSHQCDTTLACEKCYAMFNSYIDLKNHFCIKTEACGPEPGASTNNPFSCEFCSQEFPTEEVLINHCENHIALTCPICNKLLEEKSFKQHLYMHTLENNQKCDICSRKSWCKRALVQHFNVDAESDLILHAYGCSAGPQLYAYNTKFEQKYQLTEHCLIHDKKDLLVDKNYLCESCGRLFSSCSFPQNNKHMKSSIYDKKDFPIDEPYLCEFCGNQFSSYPFLQIHQQMQCLTVNIIDENSFLHQNTD